MAELWRTNSAGPVSGPATINAATGETWERLTHTGPQISISRMLSPNSTFTTGHGRSGLMQKSPHLLNSFTMKTGGEERLSHRWSLEDASYPALHCDVHFSSQVCTCILTPRSKMRSSCLTSTSVNMRDCAMS